VDFVRDELRKAFEKYIDEKIKRPELRNRLGDGFIPMDFIQPEFVSEILGKALGATAKRVADVHEARLQLSPAAREALRVESIARLEHGGRGVGNAVEAALINPLARELFGTPARPGDTLAVDQIKETGTGWEIEVRRWSA
jgi:ATP-dependent Clp protease ATP-binding subunit ClpA